MALEAGCPALLHKATVAPANKLARPDSGRVDAWRYLQRRWCPAVQL